MLDPKYFRQALPELMTAMAKRGVQLDAQPWVELEATRKRVQIHTEQLQSQRNQLAKQVGQAKAKGLDSSSLIAEAETVTQALKVAEIELADIQTQLSDRQALMPNMPDESTPAGLSERDNVEIRRWGQPRHFEFAVKDHVDLGVNLGWLDFESAVKIAGARFVTLYGPLARLQRALTQFMLDRHIDQHGYQEVYVPYLVNSDTLYGTGQLPKMEEDLFKTTFDPSLYLIPTAEVPVTNLARDKVFEASQLPQKYVCHSPCFRSEAGSYGRDTRGMLRQHQFEKVELVQFVTPQESDLAHEALTGHAEAILQALELPYRVMLLCAGDMSFAAKKTYDLEVWLPGQQAYREISSCSNCGDFQARRLMARWRNPATLKPEYLHTLNGSGVAVGRTLLAIMENYQTADGHIQIPAVLQPYLNGLTIL